MPEDVLDPAHADDSAVTVMPAAGSGTEDPKPTDAPKVSDDGNIVEVNGKKFITFDAFTSERKQRQELNDVLARLDPVMPEFEEFMKTRQQRRQSVRDTQAAGGTDDDAYLTEVATALGFYDETNQPDLRRAQAHLNISRREAERVAQRAVEPVARSTRSEMARVNRERALANQFVDGRPVAEAQYLDLAIKSLGDEQLADPNVANIIQVVAAGLEYLDRRRNGNVRQGRQGDPMYLEGGRGRVDGGGDGYVSPLAAAAARARGKTPEQWAKLSRQVNKTDRDTGTVLEDV